MPLSIALQIDPPAHLNPASDTSLLLGREAQSRGYQLYYLPPESVSQAADGSITGLLAEMDLHQPSAQPCFSLGEPRRTNLAEMDVILIRQDPPFDMAYISNSLALERLIEQGTLVLNHPHSVRNNPEKLLPLRFPEYVPPTLISADIAEIRHFHTQYQTIVIKPLYGFGGHGVFTIDARGTNLESLLEMQLAVSKEPLVIQQFLPAVHQEEKRIILIDGKISGAIGRIPPAAEIRSNLRIGGQAVATELSEKQRSIAYDVGQFAAHHGLMLVGLDVIGDYLIEVNITSPTGLMPLKALYELTPEVDFWNAVEDVISTRKTMVEAASAAFKTD